MLLQSVLASPSLRDKAHPNVQVLKDVDRWWWKVLAWPSAYANFGVFLYNTHTNPSQAAGTDPHHHKLHNLFTQAHK